VVEVVRALPGDDLVLDGEALMLGPDGRPRPFQETASRTAQSTGAAVVPYFFDLLHLGGTDLLDAPGTSGRPPSTDWFPSSTGCPPRHRRRRAAAAFVAATCPAGTRA
jgi:hypothetical protein